MKRIFLIGGGPSLSNFNFNLLKNKDVMAINGSFKQVPFAKYLYFMDFQFYTAVTNKNNILYNDFKQFKGEKYTITNYIKDSSINIIKSTGKYGFETNYMQIKHGTNSGCGAINLAYHLGYNQIILMGYDLKTINNKHHYYEEYIKIRQSEDKYNLFLKGFKALDKDIRKLNIDIEIINTSMDSKLEIFQKRQSHFYI